MEESEAFKLTEGWTLDQFRSGLDNEEPMIRFISANKLGELKDESSVEALIELLKDKWNGVRRAAAWALGEIGDEEAVTPLIELLEDDLEDTWEGPMELSHEPLKMNRVVAKALAGIGEAALPEVREALNSKRAETREAAAWILGQVPEPGSLPFLKKALDDEWKVVRQNAVEALGSFETPLVLDDLEKTLDDQDHMVRWMAVKELGKIGGERALKAVQRMTDDPHGMVSREAGKILSKCKVGDNGQIDPTIE